MKVQVLILFSMLAQVLPGNRTPGENLKEPELNTAAKVDYLTSFEKEIIYEINLLRSNPAKYATDYIQPLSAQYKKRVLFYPGGKPIMTREGVRALNECIRALQSTGGLPLVYPSEGLTKAARDHVSDQSATGNTGHVGNDRSGFKERMERYGQWKFRIGENIAYGNFSARQIIIYLLIDDGIKDRGHRKIFLNPDFKTVGVASGSHPEYELMSVMDFAGAFVNNF